MTMITPEEFESRYPVIRGFKFLPIGTHASVILSDKRTVSLRPFDELSREAEQEWDAFCTTNGLDSKKVEECVRRRPDRLLTVGGTRVSVEIKAVTTNDSDELDRAEELGRSGSIAGVTDASKELSRIRRPLEKSGTQHRHFLEDIGTELPTMTLLVEKREPGAQAILLHDLIPMMLYGIETLVLRADRIPDPFREVAKVWDNREHQWKARTLAPLGMVGLLHNGCLTLFNNPFASSYIPAMPPLMLSAAASIRSTPGDLVAYPL